MNIKKISNDLIKNFRYQSKHLLLSINLIATINSLVKAHKLKFGLLRLQKLYETKAKKNSFLYSEQIALDTFHNRLKVLNRQFPKKKGELRVFWVGANRDQDESGFLQALRSFSKVVEFHDYKGTYGQWYWDDSGQVQICDPKVIARNDHSLRLQMQNALLEGAVDLLIGQMWGNFISRGSLAWVRSLGIPIINISMDDRLPENWGVRQGVRLGAVGLASQTDIVLTTSSETCSWYGIEGCPAIFWPLASDPDVFYPVNQVLRDIDVLFIGNNYGIRGKIIRDLMKRGINVECYGSGWPNGPASVEKSASLFQRAKIILGVGTVGYCKDVFTMKLRDFDAPMSGAMYLTHRSKDIIQLYVEGVEIECYGTTDEASEKIHYYLSNPSKLLNIADAGHKKALLRDTWTYRLSDTFFRLGILDDISVP